MIPRIALAAVIPILGIVSCSAEPTPKGELGRWAVTRYLVRVYKTDLKTAHEAGRAYFTQKGYSIEEDSLDAKKSLLHGFLRPAGGPQKSLILRTKYLAPDMTHVEMKAGPAYTKEETGGIMDEYQKLLPESAQPK